MGDVIWPPATAEDPVRPVMGIHQLVGYGQPREGLSGGTDLSTGVGQATLLGIGCGPANQISAAASQA